MSFSTVNIFQNALKALSTTPGRNVPDRIQKGGAFAPTTFEAVSLMRAEEDNQWENSYINKYQALMQNRLNRLKQDLTNAYKAILEMSTTQQIRENSPVTANTAITDVYGRTIPDLS